jgi:predicted Zn-dependent peptidase
MPSLKISAVAARVVFVAVLSTSASGQTPHGATGDVLPFTATERTLANGLKIIVVPTGFPNLVSVQIPVQTGSRNEVEPGKSGFAHFFEHLMFRGTPANPPEKYREIMGKAGARDNASTGDDYTHYYATFAKEHLEEVIALYADMFQHLAYSEADFKTEARAILGEYNKNSASPVQKLIEVQRDTYYRAHTYKHTTMGFITDIENMPNEYAYSKVFFDRWYRPQNTAIVIAGDVTPDQVMQLVEKYWGGWKPGGTVTEIPKEPAPNGPLYVHVPWPSDTLPYVTVAFPAPAFGETSKDAAAMDILAALYFGSTSELYKKLVVSEQKLDALDVDVPSNVDPSLFTIFARVKNPADALYVRDQILATISSARASLTPPQRLNDAKSYNRYAFARSLDSTERIAATVAAYASYRRSYGTVNAYFRTLETLTPDDLQSAARKYFTDAGMIVTTLARNPLTAGIERPPSLATVTLDDVKQFAKSMYTRANLTVGISGDAPDGMVQSLRVALSALPEGPSAAKMQVKGTRPSGIEVEILEKDTRATAISFGFPIEVTRVHPDFAALSIARVWLGEHRIASGRLYQRIREVRGINYGDYAYIEAFPRGMFQFFPDPNVVRQQQIFEVWIRPVVPANAHMSLRIALYELDKLIQNGLTKEQFEATRDYLMNNVFVMTARQDQRLGYALDSEWYGIGEFTETVRKAVQSLTVDQVNAAIKRHLTTKDVSIVYITKDAAGLRQALVSDAFSPIKYDGEKPKELLDEDQVIGALKLNIAPEKVKITPISEVFAR